MREEDRKKMADEYFDASYKHGNILTQEQFDLASEYFARDYLTIMPTSKQAAILDLGCGAGSFLYHLKKMVYQNYYGIDVSVQQIEYCKKHVSNKVELIDGKTFLEKKPQDYELIFANDVMEHVPKDHVMDLLSLIFRSLKNGGRFVMRVPNMSNPFGLDARYNDLTHEIGYTSKSLYQILWVSGFREIKILPERIIPVKNYRNFLRKYLVMMLHQCIRFCYYIQDYTVPMNLDKNIVAVGKKTEHE